MTLEKERLLLEEENQSTASYKHRTRNHHHSGHTSSLCVAIVTFALMGCLLGTAKLLCDGFFEVTYLGPAAEDVQLKLDHWNLNGKVDTVHLLRNCICSVKCR